MKTIEIDDDIYEKLQNLAVPFVDTTPSMVLRKIIDHYYSCEKKVDPSLIKPKRRAHTRGYGKLSHQHYRIPIIEALRELGGKGTVDEVLNLVHPKVKDKLSDIDYSETLNGYIRWKNTAHFQRFKMVENGILKSGSPRGVWELDSNSENIESKLKGDNS